MGDAQIRENAQVFDRAWVYGQAMIWGNAQICGQSQIADTSFIDSDTIVTGKAKVYENVYLSGSTFVAGDAMISNNVAITHDNNVITGGTIYCGRYCGDARIASDDDYLVIRGLGSVNRSTTFYRTAKNSIKVACGCFSGFLDEFIEEVKKTHKDTKYAREYLTMVEVAKIHFELC